MNYLLDIFPLTFWYAFCGCVIIIIIIINNHNNIYSAVIMTKVIARVHSVHLVSVEQRQAAADPQTRPPELSFESPVLGTYCLQPPWCSSDAWQLSLSCQLGELSF